MILSASSTNFNPSGIIGVILAGGKSRRMGGINKALLKVSGQRIVERVVESLSKVLPRIILITNSPDDFKFLGLPMYKDLIPDRGSLGGVYTGLKVCGQDRGFLVACDMPFLRHDIIRYMISMAHKADIVIPRIRGLLEPLHAIYSPGCIPFIEELIEQKDLKIIHLFNMVHTLEIPESDLAKFDPELQFIMNVNSPEDLIKARQLAN